MPHGLAGGGASQTDFHARELDVGIKQARKCVVLFVFHLTIYILGELLFADIDVALAVGRQGERQREG